MKKLFPDSTIYKSDLWDVHQDWEMPIPGFFIMAPVREGIRTFVDLTEQESEEFMKVLRVVRKGMLEELDIKDVYFFQNEDTSHGFHFWFFPRFDWMQKFGIKIQSVRPIMEHAKEYMLDKNTYQLVIEYANKMRKYILSLDEFSSKKGNYAFIDGQNLYKGIKELGKNLDYKSFRIYLEEKFNIKKAIVFMGYMPKYQKIYDYYNRCGFDVVFKEVSKKPNGEAKGNVDAELVLESARIKHNEYDKALIISSDGDFACLVNYLKSVGKFRGVFSSRGKNKCSALLKKASKSRITYLPEIINKINTAKENNK